MNIEQINARLVKLEEANLADRFNYLVNGFEEVLRVHENMRYVKQNVDNILHDFEKRLMKIEAFTDYLLDFFNPDNKLKQRIDVLTEELKAKESELKRLRSKVKDLLS